MVRDRDPLQNLPLVEGDAEAVTVDEPTSAEWVIGEWVTLDRELHPFEALELATVIEAVKLHVLHGWPLVGADVREPGRADRHRHLGSSGRRACDRRPCRPRRRGDDPLTRRCAGSLWVVEWGGLPTILQAASSCSFWSVTDCFDPPTQVRGIPVTGTGMLSGLRAAPRMTGCRQRPSLRSDRVHHARSATAVNPLCGSFAALRSYG